MNFTNSISETDYWFVPPASCSNATQQVGLSGLLSITDNYSNQANRGIVWHEQKKIYKYWQLWLNAE